MNHKESRPWRHHETHRFERMKSLHDIDFDIYNALCDEAIPLTQKLIDEGCKIIISRGETATMIKNQLNLRDSYILEIPITDCDRLSMLTKALEYGNRIAVVGFGATMNTSKFISGIISKDVFIKFCRITSASEVENICKPITDDGFRIIAGVPIDDERGIARRHAFHIGDGLFQTR